MTAVVQLLEATVIQEEGATSLSQRHLIANLTAAFAGLVKDAYAIR